MTEAEHLRKQAERYLRLARSTTDREVARVLLATASERLEKAQALEQRQTPLPGPEHHHQPAQQQQEQIQPKKDD